MKSMYLSSGYVNKLLSGKDTKGHKELLQMFVSDEIPYHNAKSSPIDQFRTGAIIEDRFFLSLDDSYLPQYRVICRDMDVCRSTLDFAKVIHNEVVDFIETKTCFFTDFLELQPFKNAPYEDYIPYIKKYYKSNYKQVQFQMMCSGLEECTLTYIEVRSYDDEQNKSRIIQPGEYIDFRIMSDPNVIAEIKDRAIIFQQIKDYVSK